MIAMARVLDDPSESLGDGLAVAFQHLCKILLIEQQCTGHTVGHIVAFGRLKNALQIRAQMRIIRIHSAILRIIDKAKQILVSAPFQDSNSIAGMV